MFVFATAATARLENLRARVNVRASLELPIRFGIGLPAMAAFSRATDLSIAELAF
jgi:hypothetical protein